MLLVFAICLFGLEVILGVLGGVAGLLLNDRAKMVHRSTKLKRNGWPHWTQGQEALTGTLTVNALTLMKSFLTALSSRATLTALRAKYIIAGVPWRITIRVSQTN